MKLVNLFTNILLWVGAPIVGYAIAPATTTGRAIMISVCLFMVLMLMVMRRAAINAILKQSPPGPYSGNIPASYNMPRPPMPAAEVIAKVTAWQAAGFVHELTCGVDTCRAALEATQPLRLGGRVVLHCPVCGYEQEHIPAVVLGDYVEKMGAAMRSGSLTK